MRKTQNFTAGNSPVKIENNKHKGRRTGIEAVKEYENFNTHKSAINKDLHDVQTSACGYLTSKQKDKQQMNMLNKYLNYSLMKLNDEFVQKKFKTYLKAQTE